MNKGMERLLKKYGDVIESIHRENNYGVDYWIYLKKGYICKETECGTIHEYTLKDCEAMLRCVVKVMEVK